jgi:Glycosyl hydrolase family 9
MQVCIYKFMNKTMQVGRGDLDHAYWGRPEEMTMPRPAFSISPSAPGSDLAGEVAAAFAAGYLVFRNTGTYFVLLVSRRTVATSRYTCPHVGRSIRASVETR